MIVAGLPRRHPASPVGPKPLISGRALSRGGGARISGPPFLSAACPRPAFRRRARVIVPAPRRGRGNGSCLSGPSFERPSSRRASCLRQSGGGAPEASPPSLVSSIGSPPAHRAALGGPPMDHRPPDRRGLAAAGASPAAPFQHSDFKRTDPHPRRITRGASGAGRPSGTPALRKGRRRGDRIAGPRALPASARARFPSTWRGWTGDGGSMAGGGRAGMRIFAGLGESGG